MPQQLYNSAAAILFFFFYFLFPLLITIIAVCRSLLHMYSSTYDTTLLYDMIRIKNVKLDQSRRWSAAHLVFMLVMCFFFPLWSAYLACMMDVTRPLFCPCRFFGALSCFRPSLPSAASTTPTTIGTATTSPHAPRPPNSSTRTFRCRRCCARGPPRGRPHAGAPPSASAGRLAHARSVGWPSTACAFDRASRGASLTVRPAAQTLPNYPRA